MKASSTRTPISLRDFRLLFTVRSIIFHRSRPLPVRIYLEKDVQIIGTVSELLPPLSAGLHHSFSEFTPPLEFRIVGERASSYSVSLYEVEEEGERHLETAELKFSKFLEEYCREFRDLQEQLGSELREKEAGGLAKAWKSLCQRFTKKVYTSAVRFQQVDGILQFALEPMHRYDQLVREADLVEQRRRQRRDRQDDYKKAHTIPENARVEASPLRRGQTENDLTMVAPFEFESKKHISPSKLLKENKQPRGLVVLKGKEDVLSNIAEVSDSYQSFANSNRTNQVLGQHKKQRLQLPFMRIGQKRPSAEEEQVEKQPEEEERRAIPKVQYSKYLLSSESRPEDMLQIQSCINLTTKTVGKSHLRQTLWTSLILAGSLVVVYLLMHPLSRV